MKKQHERESKSINWLGLWTHASAVHAVPYLHVLVQSVREHWLDMQREMLRVRRLDARPGRRGRRALVLRAGAAEEAEQSRAALEEALQELKALDVYGLDPVRGLALIPFSQGDDLAWFVFDLFAPRGLVAWRFHADPLETRRPLAGVQDWRRPS